jgi:hypothetical protein
VIQIVLRHTNTRQQTTSRYIHSINVKQLEAQGLYLDAINVNRKHPQPPGRGRLRVEHRVGEKSAEYVTAKKNGRPVRTRTADLYRVKGQLILTPNNFEGVRGRGSTRKHAEDGLVTREITGEDVCAWELNCDDSDFLLQIGASLGD